MIWKPWSKFDFKGLARYVTPEARRWFNLGASRFDLQGGPDEKLRVVEAIYNALKGYEISYDIEGYHPSGSVQVIRPPEEILKAPKKGTCLDLATLFCGLCLDNELLPILIVLDGHALAAVSLKQGLREWEFRKELAFFEKDLLTDPAPIRQLIDEGSSISRNYGAAGRYLIVQPGSGCGAGTAG
jgi:hypothetical protein